MLKKLSTSLGVIALASTVQMSVSFDTYAAKATPAPVCPGALIDGKKRKTQLASPKVGKKLTKAFEFYNNDDVDGALAAFLDIYNDLDADDGFDLAYVSRFVAFMYAQKGDNSAKAVDFLKKAIEPNVLSEQDHAGALKLIADLQFQDKKYAVAVANYYKWMDFTCKEDANVWVKIAQAHYQEKQYAKMIEPADKAIAAYGKKPNQNPYVMKVTSYYERKMYKEAIDVLGTVLQVFPAEKRWWVQLGMFYLLVEDFPKALQTLELSYKQGYLESESHIKTLANLYAQLDVPFKAAKLLEKHMNEGLLTRDDKNLATLANVLHTANQIDEAAKVYGEIAKLTNSVKDYRKQGMLLIQDEQFKAGITALTKALELGVKDEGRVYMSIAESHFYLEQYKLANKAIQKAKTYPATRKPAKAWEGFIRDTAQRKGKSI